MITKRAFQKILDRSFNNDKYAEYFALMTEILMIISEYQSMYKNHQLELKIKESEKIIADKDATIEKKDNHIEMIFSMLKDAAQDREEFKEKIVEMDHKLHYTTAKLDNATTELAHTNIKLDNTNTKLDHANIKLDIITEYAIKKSYTSTMNPDNHDLVHYAMVASKQDGNNYVFKFISGQSEYIDIKKPYILDNNFDIFIDKFYVANGIDYRRNVQSRVKKFINDKCNRLNIDTILMHNNLHMEIEEYNSKLLIEIIEFNKMLSEKVDAYNKSGKNKYTIKLDKYGRYRYGKNKTLGRKWIYS